MSALRSSSFSRRGWNPRQLPRDLNIELDTGHPLANGLIALYAPGLSFNDLAFPQNPALGRPAAGGFATSPYGPAWNSPSSVSGSLATTGLPVRLQSQNYTLIWLGKTNGSSGSADQSLMSVAAGGGQPFVRAGLFLSSSSGLQLCADDGYQGTFLFAGDGHHASDLVNYAHIAGTFTSGAQFVYLNGSAGGAVSNHSGTLSFNTALDSIGIGDTRAGPGITTVAGFFYNRVLSADEIARHVSAPFDMLRPVVRRMYFAAAATSGGVTVTPGAGALILTGYAPTISAAASVIPGAGALALTGPIPTASAGASTIPGVGALAFSGLVPTLQAYASTTPGVGTLSLTGYVPTVSAGASISLTPGAGALTLTGLAPNVTAGAGATPGVGALTLTGLQPVAIASASTVPGAGTLTLTGYAPAVSTGAGVSVAPGVGVITLTGQQPTVRADAASAPAVGALTLTGQAPSLSLGGSTSIAVGVGTLTLTGYAPAVSASVSVTPGAGTLALTGQQPSVGLGASVQPGVGVLAFTGWQPTFQAGVSAAPGVGALMLTGRQPTVTVSSGFAATPGVGLIVLSGYAPTVQPSGEVTPIFFEAGNVVSISTDARYVAIPVDSRTVTLSGSA